MSLMIIAVQSQVLCSVRYSNCYVLHKCRSIAASLDWRSYVTHDYSSSKSGTL